MNNNNLHDAIDQLRLDIDGMRDACETLLAQFYTLAADIIEEVSLFGFANNDEVRVIEAVHAYFTDQVTHFMAQTDIDDDAELIADTYKAHADALTSLLDSITVVQR